jgi:hypothetical protein
MKKSLTLTLALCLGLSGCYGPFRLTKSIHKWNGTVGTKWVQEGFFLLMVIFPVYEFASLGDAIIFNSIEFWGGKNPIGKADIKTMQDGDRQVVMKYSGDERRLRVDSFEKGRPTSTVVFEPIPGGMAARDSKGKLLMTAKTVNGQVVMADPSGKILAAKDPAEAAAMLAAR